MIDLKTQALKACLDIYNDYDEQELVYYSLSIHKAWCIGRELEMFYEQPSTNTPLVISTGDDLGGLKWTQEDEDKLREAVTKMESKL